MQQEPNASSRQGPLARFADAWSSRPTIPALCLLGAITILAYLPAMKGGFVFDDGVYVTQDDRMESAHGLWRIWTEVGGPEYRHQYYPLTVSGFWVQHQLWGQDPFGYHFVNVLLHALNAMLLWRLLRTLRVPGAFLAAAIFAVHPVHVQSVAWVTELKNVLSTFFFLLAGIVFVQWFARGGDGIMGEARSHDPMIPRSRFLLYSLGVLLFICALLSKTATCLLPVALLLVLWWKRDRLRLRDFAAVAPLVVIGVGFVTMTVLLEGHHRAHGDAFGQTMLERTLVAGRAVCFYAGKLFWPAELIFMYPRWDVDVHAWQQYLFPLAVINLLVILWVLRPLGKGPAAAITYFVVAAAPLSFVNVAYTRLSFVADHWQYWASMGLIALVAAALWRGLSPQGSGFGVRGSERSNLKTQDSTLKTRSRRPVLALVRGPVAVVLVGTLSVLTWQRCHVFRSEETLWSDTIARNPGAWAAHNNLALALSADGRMDEAMDHFREAVRLNPSYSEGFNNYGAALMLRGRPDDAAALLTEAIRLEPDLAGAHFNLGLIRRSQGRLNDAITQYRECLRHSPRSAEAMANLGEALQAAGDVEAAIGHYRAALEIAPDDPTAHRRLGGVLRDRGELNGAIVHLGAAVAADPLDWEAHNGLGTALMAAGRLDESIGHFEEAAAIDPDRAGVLYNLGIALARQRRFGAAVEAYRAAIDLDPHYAAAHINLAIALQSAGRPGAAIVHYLDALQISPERSNTLHNLGLALIDLADERGDPALAQEVRMRIEPYRRTVPVRALAMEDRTW